MGILWYIVCGQGLNNEHLVTSGSDQNTRQKYNKKYRYIFNIYIKIFHYNMISLCLVDNICITYILHLCFMLVLFPLKRKGSRTLVLSMYCFFCMEQYRLYAVPYMSDFLRECTSIHTIPVWTPLSVGFFWFRNNLISGSCDPTPKPGGQPHHTSTDSPLIDQAEPPTTFHQGS